MAKARELTARQLYNAYKAVSSTVEIKFIELCLHDEPKGNMVRALADLAEARSLDGRTVLSHLSHVKAELEPYKRGGKRRNVERNKEIQRLRKQGLSHGEIGIHPDVVRLNRRKRMKRDAVAAVLTREREK